jgi:hypothetical protein
MRQRHVVRLAVLFAALTALGCKLPVGEEVKTDPANGTGSVKNWAFTISPSHNNFTLETGATDTTIVTVTRTGGFTGPITLEFVYPSGPDGGITTTGENVTETGAVTTSRIITKVGGGHAAVTNFTVNVHAAPASTEVQGQFFELKYNIVKKTGTFINVPATLSVGRGQTVMQRVSITRTNYDVPVPFVLALFNGAPAGITATFNPNPVTDTVTQMTINVDPSVPEGTYSLGVRDNEGTSFQGTAPVALTVTAPGTVGLTANLPTLAIPKNSTVPGGITVTRNNYPGPLTITLSGVPAGVTTAVPNPVTGNNFSINFTNSGTGTPGSYQVTVTASAPGLSSVSITITINVS